jgi:hypothetical protein
MKQAMYRLLCLLLLPLLSAAQHAASVREYQKNYKTYPFSDPDPVPAQRIYPYFRFDGFTDQPEQREWKVVELENDYIKVLILPEIGGKIWTAIDKKTGKPFLYDNDVVKFRDIAMRGPWTSGGIESNYGIIGHTPNCATPVDYLTRRNADNSVSCFISTLDLLTRTKWTVEIRLPADKGYFLTRSFWHNGTPLVQPYYSWANLGIKTGPDLEFLYPGTNYIGHDGKPGTWPREHDRNLSVYAANNFGADKSYHVLGTHSNYFGAYWRGEDFGMVHYANREDKLGKKVFLWALSDQGKIWERLLTDKAGQYCEIQSGRLFNQNMENSSLTPFRQVGFQPYASDTWEEYWFPFRETGGFTGVSLHGVVYARQEGRQLNIAVSPLERLNDSLQVYDASGRLLYGNNVQLLPLQAARYTVPLPEGARAATVVLAGATTTLDTADTEKQLSRPLTGPEGFDQHSAYGHYMMGRDLLRFRNYAAGEARLRAALAIDPHFVPALVEMAFIHYRKMAYDSAFACAKHALSIDTYDAGANYYYGLAAARLGRYYDALDGLEVATLTTPFRDAANTELARLYLLKNDPAKAGYYALKSCANNRGNINGLLIQGIAGRQQGRRQEAAAAYDSILALDPLNHFARFEQYLLQPDDSHRKAFQSQIRNELPQETYLEMAIWYYNTGLLKEAQTLLDLSPAQSEIAYWKAYLHRQEADYSALLAAADSSNPALVFPFREESAPVMKWAMETGNNWKPRYYLALIYLFRNDSTQARELLQGIPESVAFAPLYALRSRLYENNETAKRHADIARSAALSPGEWRYGKMLTEQLITENAYADALKTITPYHQRSPKHYITTMLYARCLVLNKRYTAAEKVLADVNVLPYEGAQEGHHLYRKVKLLLALDALDKKRYAPALEKINEARQWPLNLGAGAPYNAKEQEQLEDALQRYADAKENGSLQELRQQVENLR